MPVNYIPLVFTIFLIIIPLLCAFRSKKLFLIASTISVFLIIFFLMWSYIPGWILMSKARDADPKIQYELARWYENHCAKIQQYLLWPCKSDTLTGYTWLEKAAEQNYPPALYTLGVRLKYGEQVPRPQNWIGPAGNVYPQPERGQPLIDKALQLGYEPQTQEESHYMTVYRNINK